MPANPYYFPSRDADIGPWLANFDDLITANPTDYGLTAPDAVIINAQRMAWDAAYALAVNPATRTPVTVAAKDVAKATMRSIVLPYATAISANPAVLDADKVAVGVTVRISTRTPISAPGAAPGFDLLSLYPGEATLRTYDLSTPTSKKMPYGAVGIEVVQSLGTAPAVDPDAASFSTLVSKSPSVIAFAPSDAGKVATLWARYRMRPRGSEPGRYSPWSAPLVFTVPG